MSVTALTVGVLVGGANLGAVPAAPPVLLLTPERVRQMKSLVRTDADYRNLISFLDRQFDARSFENDMRGANPTLQGRRVQWEIVIGSTLWKVNDDQAAGDRALAALRAAIRIPAYKDSDYLGTTELMSGMTIGYSLFYDRLSDSERRDVLAKFRDQGFRWARAQKNNRVYWTTIYENAPTVANASLLLASLVAPVGDRDAGDQRALFRTQAPLLRSAYGSTGGSAEGVMYWNYAAYAVLLAETAARDAGQPVASQDSVLGRMNPSFLIYTYGPTGLAYNYGDSFEAPIPAPVSFVSSQPGDHYWYRRHIADSLRGGGKGWYWQEYRYLALAAMLWTQKGGKSDLEKMPLDKVFIADDVVGSMRESFTNPNAAFAAYRGGSSKGVHSQLDMGSFIYEADGVRWIVDPGQDAAKDDYFDIFKDGRWTWLRTANEGHSLLIPTGGGNRPARIAPSDSFSPGGSSPYGALNLGPSYGLDGYTRVFQLVNRRSLQIKDMVAGGLGAGRWQAVTRAQVSTSGATATMRQAGKSATLTVLEPSGVRVRTTALGASSGKKVNASVSDMTAITFDVPRGTKQVIVRISPN